MMHPVYLIQLLVPQSMFGAKSWIRVENETDTVPGFAAIEVTGRLFCGGL